MASELGVQTIQHTNGTDALSIGADGKITPSSGYAMNTAVAGVPALQFIQRADLSTTASDTDITGVFSSDFDQYKIVFKMDDLGDNQDNSVSVRFLKASDGSVESSTIYTGIFWGTDQTETNRGGGTTGGTQANLINTASRGGGEVTIVDPFTANRTWMHGKTYNYRSSNGIKFFEDLAYEVDSTTSYSGIRVVSNNPLNGYVLVYGWVGS